MKVTVIGKEMMSGTSKKTGQPYEATIAHVQYKKSKCEGFAVDNVWIDSSLCPAYDIEVGSNYDLDRDGRGFIISFERVI